MVIIFRYLKLKRNAAEVQTNDMRYASCLTVAPTAMDATATRQVKHKSVGPEKKIQNL